MFNFLRVLYRIFLAKEMRQTFLVLHIPLGYTLVEGLAWKIYSGMASRIQCTLRARQQKRSMQRQWLMEKHPSILIGRLFQREAEDLQAS